MARPRTPSSVKALKGTSQPCRTNKHEPKPRKGTPSPPDHLSERAKACWATIAAVANRMGTLTEASGLWLEGVSGAWAELIEARLSLRQKGDLTYQTVTKDGSVMNRPHPEVAMIADADRRFGFWLTKGGLTPADLSRVSSVDDGLADSPWVRFR